MRNILRGLALFVVGALTIPSIQDPAIGVTTGDTTPPTPTAPSTADFVVGSAIGAMVPDPLAGLMETNGIRMRATWRATDASGICGYSTRPEWVALIGVWSPWA